MARIAVGGIQHETNVFAPYQAGYDVFAQCDEWPPLCHGSQMLDYLRGVNLPATGSIAPVAIAEPKTTQPHGLVLILTMPLLSAFKNARTSLPLSDQR